jgi:hypothetical protein
MKWKRPERSGLLDEATAEPEEERADRALRKLLRSLGSTDSFGLVLVLIVVSYAFPIVFDDDAWAVPFMIAIQSGTIWFALRTSNASRRLTLVAAGIVVVALASVVLNAVVQAQAVFLALVFVGGTFLYFIAPLSIIRHIGYRRDVDQETLLGALAAYLLIGMAFAFAYRLLGVVQSTPFFGANGDGTMSDTLFFSFITMTTTGYGNLVPANNPGQSLAVVEALIGQLFLVTAVTKIVSAWRPRAWGTLPEAEAFADRADEPASGN